MGRVLLIGSGNKDKRAELEHLLQGTSWDVKSLKDFEPVEEPEETEDTLEMFRSLWDRRTWNLLNT